VHPFGDLSAYLDDALSPEARALVQAHLDACALCRTRLAELRGTARLIAALPMPVPSRSLVPRISVPVWLAPLRTFATFATGAAIFLFLASSVIAFLPRTQSVSTAGAPAPNAVSAPQASGAAAGGAVAATPSSGNFQASAPSPAPAVTSDQTKASGSATPSDAAKEVGRLDSAAPRTGVVADQSTRAEGSGESRFAFLLSPLLWLVLAIAFGALAFVVGRRLRST
jgi:anti-sigma factor RsiW